VSRRAAGLALWLLAGCAGGGNKPVNPPEPEVATDDPATRHAELLAVLRDDILSSYERDEPPELDSGMIDPKIGTARIGAGPGDVYLANDLARAPTRWPLDVDRLTPTAVRSKHLDIQIAADQTAAWISDELSWRITMCGRVAVIPLRITALYAHDGDRWVPVFEHLSFGWTPTPGAAAPRSIKTEVASGDLRDELSGLLNRAFVRTPRDPLVMAQDASALVLGPDVADEWHGATALQARVPGGAFEDRRVGLVGRNPAAATVAYWVGNYTADVPARPGVAAGKTHLRVTHVFEKRHRAPPSRERGGPGSAADSCAPSRDQSKTDKNADCQWLLVQTHMSQPINDDDLTQRVFGTSLISPKPLQLDCSDGVRAPAAVPRRGVVPPAARSR
jgi:hypothetical protein